MRESGPPRKQEPEQNEGVDDTDAAPNTLWKARRLPCNRREESHSLLPGLLPGSRASDGDVMLHRLEITNY